MFGNFLIIMPTRGRRANAMEAIASVFRSAEHPWRIRMVICNDLDDPEHFSLDGVGIRTITGPRKSFCKWLNEGFEQYVSPERDSKEYSVEWVAWLGDDVRYLTRGWDTIVDACTELVVYGMDGYQDEKMATHPFIRTRLVRWLGYFCPPDLSHICPDLFYQDLAREIGSLRYDNRIYTRHLHPDAGFGGMDKTYEEAMKFHAPDRLAYEKIKLTIPELAQRWRTDG